MSDLPASPAEPRVVPTIIIEPTDATLESMSSEEEEDEEDFITSPTHPVNAIIKRLGKEDSQEEGDHYYNMWEEFLEEIEKRMLKYPKEFFTRKVVLGFIHVHNHQRINPEGDLQLLDPKKSDDEFLAATKEICEEGQEVDKAMNVYDDAKRKLHYALHCGLAKEQTSEAKDLLTKAEHLINRESPLMEEKLEEYRINVMNDETELPEVLETYRRGVAWKELLDLSEKAAKLLVDIEVPPPRTDDVGEYIWFQYGYKRLSLSMKTNEAIVTLAKNIQTLENHIVKHDQEHTTETMVEVPVWELLLECRMIVKAAKGEDPSTDIESDGQIQYRENFAHEDAKIVGEYRRHAVEVGSEIDARVYEKAVAYIKLIESAVPRERWPTKLQWPPAFVGEGKSRGPVPPKSGSGHELGNRLRLYLEIVQYNEWSFDHRVLEALETIVEQGYDKVSGGMEEDETLSAEYIQSWVQQAEMAVLIRHYAKRMKEEGKHIDDDVLDVAEHIIDLANEQYHDDHPSRGSTSDSSEHGGAHLEHNDSESAGGAETGAMDDVLPPIAEHPEAEAEAESESTVKNSKVENDKVES